MTGLPVFHSLYDKNANVFAAIPSLHAAYMLVTVLYALKYKQSKLCVSIFAVICCGIWFTAVYSGHHYIIDVLLGIFTALAGILLLECVLFHIPMINQLMKKYLSIIS
jgi:membrane-associated phospholipid phosphatase